MQVVDFWWRNVNKVEEELRAGAFVEKLTFQVNPKDSNLQDKQTLETYSSQCY